MFNKLIHLLTSMSKEEDNLQGVQESVKLLAKNNFINDLTNNRKVGDVENHNAMLLNGHKKIGNFINRGIAIQKRKIKEG